MLPSDLFACKLVCTTTAGARSNTFHGGKFDRVG
jgi:hypothetical protein